MIDRSKATTHADDCWSWGPGHYKCAVSEIERLQRENAKLLAATEAIDLNGTVEGKEPVPSNGCGCEGACAKRMGHEVQGECAADEHERSVEATAVREHDDNGAGRPLSL